MMEAKFPDGHKERTGPSPLAAIFKDTASVLERGALYAKIIPVHAFVGGGNRCRVCGKKAYDALHQAAPIPRVSPGD